ncbi:unnamed protein product [Mytilus edulis]|uniref:Uncharacterized protein n=1 Tax=Mytilus edulis TaxID=6550 RepID=A0A8S3PZW4_MYTED|nr:unnamed protein product [Mytilus edulis]
MLDTKEQSFVHCPVSSFNCTLSIRKRRTRKRKNSKTNRKKNELVQVNLKDRKENNNHSEQKEREKVEKERKGKLLTEYQGKKTGPVQVDFEIQEKDRITSPSQKERKEGKKAEHSAKNNERSKDLKESRIVAGFDQFAFISKEIEIKKKWKQQSTNGGELLKSSIKTEDKRGLKRKATWRANLSEDRKESLKKIDKKRKVDQRQNQTDKIKLHHRQKTKLESLMKEKIWMNKASSQKLLTRKENKM